LHSSHHSSADPKKFLETISPPLPPPLYRHVIARIADEEIGSERAVRVDCPPPRRHEGGAPPVDDGELYDAVWKETSEMLTRWREPHP